MRSSCTSNLFSFAVDAVFYASQKKLARPCSNALDGSQEISSRSCLLPDWVYLSQYLARKSACRPCGGIYSATHIAGYMFPTAAYGVRESGLS